ncbi:hypothetical protein A0J61_04345 [Choanephora cucurbitarum]|uniref:Uncharacterized protein n=1 Tax=Choanephora cucurbitarum TaxID=101091 RepID=A0A1C7NEP0_9FUNG|nr:hypothetical protein A0J61_04345 [Choanephora cucurbitarum]
MYKECKKKKDKEGLALVAITRQFAKNKNWEQSKTEESFIDQHLLPFLTPIFLNDGAFSHSRSAERISLSDSSLSASKGKDSCMMLKPDFCIVYEFKGNGVRLLAITVKLPNAASSQLLSDRSKLGLEMKRMVDEQTIQGSFEPKSFGVLVEGFECTLFVCTLEQNGCYLFVKVEKLWMLRSWDDMMIIPDLVRAFMKIKAICYDRN